jgi:hypothetical protein
MGMGASQVLPLPCGQGLNDKPGSLRWGSTSSPPRWTAIIASRGLAMGTSLAMSTSQPFPFGSLRASPSSRSESERQTRQPHATLPINPVPGYKDNLFKPLLNGSGYFPLKRERANHSPLAPVPSAEGNRGRGCLPVLPKFQAHLATAVQRPRPPCGTIPASPAKYLRQRPPWLQPPARLKAFLCGHGQTAAKEMGGSWE